jgi:nucleoside-diphosphate-sugar epimerase
VIPTIVSQALKEPEVRLGSLTPERDLCDVTDTVTGFIAAAECDAAVGQVVNIGTGSCVTVGELARTVLRLVRSDKVIVYDAERIRPPQSEVQALICDNRKAASLLGWRPSVDLESGLGRVIEFMQANADRYRSEVYNR